MIKIKKENSFLKYQQIWFRLFVFNKKRSKFLQKMSDYSRHINFFAYNNKKLVGGAMCIIRYNWIYIDILHVEEQIQGKGIGSALIKEVEKYAKNKNLKGIHVDTFDFQARPFYEKCGFKVIGHIEDMPPESGMWILTKKI